MYIAPGNGGTTSLGNNIDIKVDDIDSLCNIAKELKIDLAVIGPEVPLEKGIVDEFEKHNIAIFGPTRSAARIESSKVFAKHLMHKYGIPCAASESFSDYEEALKYLRSQRFPIVIKADGLAAGKGVIVSQTKTEAEQVLNDIMNQKIFGMAGNKVVIEEFLSGKEVSLLSFTDGKTVLPMVPACDYKRAWDNDIGLNTGGMGSYSPPHFFDRSMLISVTDNIIKPTVKAMADENALYKGVLYTGLMLTEKGPKVLEYNARFGDPETQVILPRLKTDLVDIMQAVVEDRLDGTDLDWNKNVCVGVVMASGGYPQKYQTGYTISGLENIDSDILVFHAGTKREKDNSVTTTGGRVLTVTGTASNIAEARKKVYRNIDRIEFRDCHYRTDIALREV